MRNKTTTHKKTFKKRAKITTLTLAEAKARVARGEDRSDWARVDAMTDQDIERAIDADPDAAPRLEKEFWKNARLLVQAADAPKSTITIRIDTDVLNKIKLQGQGYQSRINAVLRAYVATLETL